MVDDLGKRLGNAVFARAALLHHGQCRGGVVLHRSQRLVEFVRERTCHFAHGDEVRRAFGGLGLHLHQVFDFLSVGDIRDGEHFRRAFARPGQHASCHRQPTTVFLVMNFGRMTDGGRLIEEVADAHVSFDTLPPVFAVKRVGVQQFVVVFFQMNDAYGCIHGFDHHHGALVLSGQSQTSAALFGNVSYRDKPTHGFGPALNGF